MKKILLILALLPLFSSCKDELETPDFDQEPVVNQLVTVSDEGYLSFPTYESLIEYFEQLQNGQQPIVSPFSRNGKEFKSIAALDEELTWKSRSESSEDEDFDDLEEMSEDEYNLMKAENLIFDNLLMHAMDTTLRICVEGSIYKITKYGTFSATLEKEKDLDRAILDFDLDLIEQLEGGETTPIDSCVQFTNSFKDDNLADLFLPGTFPIEPIEIIGNQSPAQAPSVVAENKLHAGYNVDTYKWKNTNIFKKFLDLIRGKDVSKAKKFSKNYRVQVNVFDVNYAFYKSAGVKVKMQKRKKFLGISYWVPVTAGKLAIGFNELQGELIYNNPNNFSDINPSASAAWGKFTGTINGIVGGYIYGAYNNLSFIKDWTSTILTWMPELKIGDIDYTNNFLNKIYNVPPKLIYQQTKKLIKDKIFNNIEPNFKSTDPVLAYLIWGKTAFKFSKEKPFITGIMEYSNCKSKSVIFDRSFGFSFKGGLILPFTPSDFNIESIDVFGAAYFDDRWLGIRFIQNNIE